MKVSQKLKIIINTTHLSQEKLAQQLGVSFATINSWINERSQARKKAKEQIDILYLKYTGELIIPNSIIDAKKKLIIKKSQETPQILQKILNNPDIYDQFILSLTYNTNSIEGSTLSENETADILFRNKALINKSLIEQLEVKNHQSALEYLLNILQNTSNIITENLILTLHSKLMNGIRQDAGFYRNHGVRIVGANVPTANYMKVPTLMTELIEKTHTNNHDIIMHCSKIHSLFEKIHPFSDGNGRIGRLLMTGMLLIHNIPPAIIKNTNKSLYYTYLKKSQIEEDISLLEDFICDAVFEGFDILER